MKYGYYWIRESAGGKWEIAMYSDYRGEAGWTDCFGLIEPKPFEIGPYVEPPL